MTLPQTPAILRIAKAHIGQWPTRWHEERTCPACNGQPRGYRNAAGEFLHSRELTAAESAAGIEKSMKARGYTWWACETCRAIAPKVDVLPLDLVAGLNVARERLAEIAAIVGWQAVDRATNESNAPDAVRLALLTLDPEMREAS
jgi:hypothetical protein